MSDRNNWPIWLPYIGWRIIEAEESLEIDLPVRTTWKVFVIAWFGFGLTLLASPSSEE